MQHLKSKRLRLEFAKHRSQGGLSIQCDLTDGEAAAAATSG